MKIVPYIVGTATIIGLITGIFAIDSRYVTNEKMAVFAQSVDTKLETQRYQSLTDRYYQMRQLEIQHPEDKQLKEEVQAVKQEREESKKALDKTIKGEK